MQNDTKFRHRPPVRIGLRMAATRKLQLDRPAAPWHQGSQAFVQAGPNGSGYGMREVRFSSVSLMTRFVRNAGPSARQAIRGTKPINYTIKKRGVPSPSLEETGAVGRPVARPGSPGWGLNA